MYCSRLYLIKKPALREPKEKTGGPLGGRTLDLGIKSPLLYQLS